MKHSWARLVNLYEQRILLLLNAWSPDHPAEWEEAVHRVAEMMARDSATSNGKSWREAAMNGSRSREIFAGLKAEIRRIGVESQIREIAKRNARLISSLPAEISERVTQESVKLQIAGARASEVERRIRVLAPYIAKTKAKLIARTEISRAETELTQARAREIGIPAYVWQTSEDQRVRKSHRNLDGVIVMWDDPPAPEKLVGEKSSLGRYHAGAAPNCRCLALPLADLAEVRWPARVYKNGAVVRMRRKQFEEIQPLVAVGAVA